MFYEKIINKKVVAKQVIACLVVMGLFIGTFFLGKELTVRKIGKAVFTNNNVVEIIEENWENPYEGLLNDEYASYIIYVCESFQLDPNIPIAILLKENPKMDPSATNRNPNGTVDCGLFQINSSNIVYFADLYWPFEKYEHFDVFNWQHNTYLAIRLIDDLYNSFNKDLGKAIAAYNAGITKVMRNDIPESTIAYQTEVLNNYKLLSNS